MYIGRIDNFENLHSQNETFMVRVKESPMIFFYDNKAFVKLRCFPNVERKYSMKLGNTDYHYVDDSFDVVIRENLFKNRNEDSMLSFRTSLGVADFDELVVSAQGYYFYRFIWVDRIGRVFLEIFDNTNERLFSFTKALEKCI